MSSAHFEVPRQGTRRPFPSHRQIVLDIVRHAQIVPSFPLIRSMQLGELASTRTSAAVRIGWTTLFVKAFALVSEQLPEFRDVFVRYPRNQLYRHPHS
ncbi:MAG: hypothetical protein ABL921_31325, partial [Pirellula sp.]